uniref:Sugar phosphate transporter domain-containing protein n=1 Tax=Oryza barthii TaxID=65489 RepID=A0A0D3HR59_9ORYZ
MTIEKRTSPQQPPTLLPTNCSTHFLYARAPTTAGVTPRQPHQSYRSYLAQMGGTGDDGAKAPAAAAAMDVVSSSSSSPAPAPSVLKSVLLSYAYVSVWITLSFSVIVYNKYILDPKMYNWPFPISLTMIHMAFCASLAVVLVRVLRVVAVPASPPMTPSLYASSLPRLRAAAGAAVRPDVFVFGTNSLCAFALNLAVFLLVGKTSALTMNVAGVVKDWLLIAFSWTVIKDTVTPVNLVGYGIAFLGVAYYNHAKLQGLKAREAERRAASMATAKDGDAEAGARLLPEKDAGEQKN